MSNQLLPCPYCGDTQLSSVDMVYLHKSGPVKGLRIKCGTCGAQAPDTCWNHRATQPAAGEPVATWVALTAAGQLRKGDKIRFRFGQETLTETVALVLDAGTEREEIVYNRKRNFYFITSKALAGTSSAKEVEVLRTVAAPPAAAHGDSLSFSTAQELATAIRQVTAYEDLGPELIAEEMFKQAGAVEAAHGDEAVRKDAERYRWISANVIEAEVGRSSEFHTDWRRAWKLPLLLSQNAVAATFTFDEAIDAAMRAQGDGESV